MKLSGCRAGITLNAIITAPRPAQITRRWDFAPSCRPARWGHARHGRGTCRPLGIVIVLVAIALHIALLWTIRGLSPRAAFAISIIREPRPRCCYPACKFLAET